MSRHDSHTGHNIQPTRRGIRCLTCARDNNLRTLPARRGEGDEDHAAIERAVMGDPPSRLLTAEREQVVRRLNGIGMTDGQIAQRLDIGVSGVWTIRTRLGLPARAAGRKPRKARA